MESPTPRLSPDSIDAAVADERRRLVHHVRDLTDEQWATRSLCAAWTVRDVIAHLAGTTRVGVAQIVPAAIRARGNFDRMEVRLAATRAAAFTTAELVAQLHDSAQSTRRTPGSKPMDPLMDLVIHAQDIARPLGRPYVSPPEVVAACLDYVAGNRFMGGPKRLAGVRVVSTATGWARGDGPEIRGADIDLLLVAAGRRAGLAGTSGPGVPVVAERLG